MQNIIIVHKNFLELKGFEDICIFNDYRMAFLYDKNGYAKNIAIYPGKKDPLPICEFEFNIVLQDETKIINDSILSDCLCQQLFIKPGDTISFWAMPDGSYLSKSGEA